MNKITVSIIVLLLLTVSNILAQENQTVNENWFKRHFEQRIYLGLYDSFGEEKANVVQAGYDAVLNLINIKPEWYLLDFCLGLDVLFVRDYTDTEIVDYFGRHHRLIPAFELNWGVRLYFLQIPKIKTSFYLEAVPVTLVVYTQPYPDSGTHVNMGTHIGFGLKSQVNDTLNVFATLRILSHTSNGQAEINNPGLDMVGLIVGIQF
jgi:hypothetical protein